MRASKPALFDALASPRGQAILPYLAALAAVLLVVALAEYSLGRLVICACGSIKLWHGDIWSSENSQHLTDWYTFSHIIHGFGLYYVGRLFGALGLLRGFTLALFFEGVWEVVENTSVIINRYRETTMSLDYFGDSIVNSLADIVAMSSGFALAAVLSVRLILLLTVVMELGTLYVVRDNLTLNIVTLLFNVPGIRQWQLGQ